MTPFSDQPDQVNELILNSSIRMRARLGSVIPNFWYHPTDVSLLRHFFDRAAYCCAEGIRNASGSTREYLPFGRLVVQDTIAAGIYVGSRIRAGANPSIVFDSSAMRYSKPSMPKGLIPPLTLIAMSGIATQEWLCAWLTGERTCPDPEISAIVLQSVAFVAASLPLLREQAHSGAQRPAVRIEDSTVSDEERTIMETLASSLGMRDSVIGIPLFLIDALRVLNSMVFEATKPTTDWRVRWTAAYFGCGYQTGIAWASSTGSINYVKYDEEQLEAGRFGHLPQNAPQIEKCIRKAETLLQDEECFSPRACALMVAIGLLGAGFATQRSSADVASLRGCVCLPI